MSRFAVSIVVSFSASRLDGTDEECSDRVDSLGQAMRVITIALPREPQPQQLLSKTATAVAETPSFCRVLEIPCPPDSARNLQSAWPDEGAGLAATPSTPAQSRATVKSTGIGPCSSADGRMGRLGQANANSQTDSKSALVLLAGLGWRWVCDRTS